jgi:uncharacterized repeat protein (TIGR03803 family)
MTSQTHASSSPRTSRRILFALAATFIAIAVGTPAAHAQTFSVLHSFTGGSDGAFPQDALTVGPPGVLYGTTALGGTLSNGTVFKLNQVNSNWFFNSLYQFTGGNDGSKPIGGLTIGPNGALYGTTQLGGAHGDGLVFSLAPPPTRCSSIVCYWNQTLLYTFTGSPDGFNPWTEKLVFDSAGNIYGTTGNGGAYGGGTAFQLTPSAGGYTETVLHSFGHGTDGAYPFGGVVVDAAGNVYGATENGGPGRECDFGCGTVYQVTPSNGSWSENILHDFDVVHGYYPNSDMISDASGNLYGTAIASLDYNDGVVFKLAPSGSGFTYSFIYQFTTDCEPYGAPTMDSAGNIFGTCLDGGNGGGWVYELTNCSQLCSVIDLHDFTYNGREGSYPWGGPTLDANGNLYGTTVYGGTGFCNGGGCGVVWEIAGVAAPSKR